MRYTAFLAQLHALLEPRAYLEIGVRNGVSMSQARCPSVGVDPDFDVTAELSGEVHLYRTTGDEFFARPQPLEALRGRPVDLAFIDGLHLFEFALRDFINVERNSDPAAVIIFDDVLPRTVDEAARARHTSAWTGDVFSIIPAMRKWRPNLATILVDTQPTGLMLVLGLDPEDTTLADEYVGIMEEFRKPDPQPVPQQLLSRSTVHAPQRILDAGFWSVLLEQRNSPDKPDFHHRLREQLARDLGDAYAPAR